MSSTRFSPKLMTMLLQVWMMTMEVGERAGPENALSQPPSRSPFSRYPLPPVRRGLPVGAAPGEVVGQRVADRGGVQAQLRQQLPAGRCDDVVIGIEGEHGSGLPCRAPVPREPRLPLLHRALARRMHRSTSRPAANPRDRGRDRRKGWPVAELPLRGTGAPARCRAASVERGTVRTAGTDAGAQAAFGARAVQASRVETERAVEAVGQQHTVGGGQRDQRGGDGEGPGPSTRMRICGGSSSPSLNGQKQ